MAGKIISESNSGKTEKTAMGGALVFITLMGIVSMFSDMTHEGARSILGEYLNLTGASVATIGFVSGLGELCGYSLRLLSGFIADKSKKYWTLVILGYGMQMAAVPLLALVPRHGIIPKNMRSTGFGIFETGFGIAWFLGSWALGALYDHNTKLLVTVSVLAQIIAIMFYIFSIHAERQNKER